MEIRMRSLNSATREKRVEGVNTATIKERPAPPDQEGTFQLYSDDYPSFLKDVCSEDQWKELMGAVNELWRPIHEESVDLLKNTSWWDYTVFGVVRRQRKQQQLAAHIVTVAASISAHLDVINKQKLGFRVRFKQTNIKTDEAEADYIYPLFVVRVTLRLSDRHDDPAGSAENN